MQRTVQAVQTQNSRARRSNTALGSSAEQAEEVCKPESANSSSTNNNGKGIAETLWLQNGARQLSWQKTVLQVCATEMLLLKGSTSQETDCCLYLYTSQKPML